MFCIVMFVQSLRAHGHSVMLLQAGLAQNHPDPLLLGSLTNLCVPLQICLILNLNLSACQSARCQQPGHATPAATLEAVPAAAVIWRLVTRTGRPLAVWMVAPVAMPTCTDENHAEKTPHIIL